MTAQHVSTAPPFSAALADFRDGRDTPRAFLERCLERIDAKEETLRAFVHLDAESARRTADEATARYQTGRPLSAIDGMPIGVKDIIDTADMPTQMNSEMFAQHRPKGDAACVRATRAGGGVLVGKTVTTEFAIGRSGPTLNPHDLERTPGGSSSGSAAGVAAGLISAAFGTQTQGSIVRPASFCGVVGYKPTLGALSTDGVHPLSRSHDHLGVLADSVADAWALARWVSEQAVGAGHGGLCGPLNQTVRASAPLRAAVVRTHGLDELDAASGACFEEVLRHLSAQGLAILGPQDIPALSEIAVQLDQVPERSLDIVAYEMRWPYLGYIAHSPEQMGPRLHELMSRAGALNRDDYLAHLTYRANLQVRVTALSDEVDILLLPAASGPAPLGHAFTGSRTLLVYCSFLGLPVYSIPAARLQGMPFGVQVIGFPNQDHRLTAHATWVAEALAQAQIGI